MDNLSIFLMEIPFKENEFIANLILVIFFVSLAINLVQNIFRIKFYNKNSKDVFLKNMWRVLVINLCQVF